jgi:RNA polymerase sigma factor (sigma-70 family)
MASARAGDLGRHLGRLFGAGTAVGLTDGELLERFAQRRDKSAEDAFETLLFRHGAMVLTICQHLLRDVHAAEDVFQATFLVLVRRAGSLRIRDHGSVGPWLYGVAYRLALKGREGAARRRRRERRVAVAQVEEASTAVEDYEFQALVHDEVNRLPTKYRAPIVLCYFEGRTHDEAAAALRWPVGTVRGRLARARDLLRARLSRRGLAPAEWFEATLLGPGARIEPPAQLLEATVTAAIDGIPAVAAGAMANLMLRGLFMARLGMTAAIFAMVLMMAGFGLAIGNMPRWQPSLGPHRPPASVATVQTALPAFDSVGDPLPKYALARMGTTRFHGGSLVNQVLYTPDGKSLVTVDNIPIVRVWDASTGQLVRDIGDRQADFPEMTPSRAIALSPDGQTLVTVDYPNQLRLWDLATGRESRRWREVKGAVYGHPLFSPDGRSVTVSVTRDDEANNTSETFIELCEIASPTERRRRIPGGWVRLWDLKFSPDGKTLAAASRDSDIMRGNTLIGPDKATIRLWDNDAGRERRRISLNRLDVRSIAFSSDGKTLAAAVNVGTVRFYNVDTGQEDIPPLGLKLPRRPGKDVEALLIPPEGSGRLAFSPDGTLLAFRHAAIQLWDVNQGLELRRFADNLQGVTSISFSPDGKTLASSGGGPELRLWDVATGREAFSRSGHSAAIRSLVVSPADGTVFTGGDDGTILHWDPSSGRELDPVAPLAGPVDELAVAPNGTTLLVAGRMDPYEQPGARISLWSVAENRQILRLGAFTDHDFTNLAYAPDGKTFASEGLIWDVSSGRLLSRLRHQDPRHGDYLHFSPIFYVPDGKHVITAEPDGVWIWDSATGRELRQAIRWLNYHDRATLARAST